MGAFNRWAYNQVPYNAPGLTYEPPDSLRPDVRSLDPQIVDTRGFDPKIQSVYTGPPRYDVVLSNFVSGDTFYLQRIFTGLDTTRTQIAKVYLTIHIGSGLGTIFDIMGPNVTLEPVRQCIILQFSSQDSVGEITDPNPSNGSIAFFVFMPPERFTVSPLGYYPGTITLTPGQEYSYDLQAVSVTGTVYTLETGIIIPSQP